MIERLPLLLVAALALGVGAWRVAEGQTDQWVGVGLMSAGLVVLGAWLAMEVSERWRR